MKKAISGFTIVELLLVIVVIGILATISAVAYNGVLTRAENTKTINAMSAYTKLFTLYAADKGSYPTATAYACLGGGWTGSCGVSTSGSPACSYSGTYSVDATFNTQLAEYSTSLPAMSTQTMSCKGETYKGSFVYPNNTNTKNMSITMQLKAGTDCPSILGTAKLSLSLPYDQLLWCYYAMPAL